MKTLLLLLFISSNALALYGEDDRSEVYQLKDKNLKDLTRAMAYQVERHYELRGWTFNRFWTIVTRTFEGQGICVEEKYSSQPSMRNNCTGILIAPKILLTAGNCITEHYCKNDLYYWMFDYNLKSESSFNVKRSRKNFYLCKRVLKRVYDPNSAMSYALLELKKEVRGVRPVVMNLKDDLKDGDPLVTMGHLRGLPLKIDTGGKASYKTPENFVVNSDISGSTLGSGVFNAKTYELEGLIVHGTRSHTDQGRGCREEQVLDDSEPYEFVIRAHLFKDLLP